MATISLEYNTRNSIAQKTIEYVLSLGAFKVKPVYAVKKNTSLLDKAIMEIKTGKTTHCENFDDYLKKVGYAEN